MSEYRTIDGKNKTDLFRFGTENVLITGGAGFIGSHIVDSVLRWFPTAEITIVDAFTYAANPENLRSAMTTGRVSVVHGCVRDRALMERSIMPGALVIHLAAESHVPRSFADPDLFDRVNRGGTEAIMQAALSSGAGRVVHFSTDEVYGNRLVAADEDQPLAPTTPYARSKANAEFEVIRAREGGLNVAVVRPSNAVGLRQHAEKLLPTFVRQALTGQSLSIEGSGRQLRTFLNVMDLTEALKLVLQHGDPNGTYNIDGAETFCVLDVAEIVTELAGCPCHVRYVPDRKVNDQAYMLDGRRLAALGFCPKTLLRTTVTEILAAMRQTSLFDTPPLVPDFSSSTVDDPVVRLNDHASATAEGNH